MTNTQIRLSTTRRPLPLIAWLQSLLGALALTLLAACSGIPISYYDATTYTQLTSLKAETGTLVELFDKKLASDNEAKIEAVTLSFRKAVEYERGKGNPNSDTTTQFEKISKLFLDTIQEARENPPGKLGPKYFSEAAKVLGQAFDTAVKTENLKNKDKR